MNIEKMQSVGYLIGNNLDHTGLNLIKIEDICCFCGFFVKKGIRKKQFISSCFTDYEKIKFKSEYICGNCAACMSGNSFNGKALRNYSFLCFRDKIEIMNKKNFLDFMINGMDVKAHVIAYTFLKRKHCFFNCQINFSNSDIYIGTDIGKIYTDRNVFIKLHDDCNILYQAGVQKKDILNCFSISKGIVDNIYLFENLKNISKYKNTKLLKLVVDLLIKNERGQNDKD